MDRKQLQDFSASVTYEYGVMLGEMTLNKAPAQDAPITMPDHWYVKVVGLSSRWIREERPAWELMSELTSGLYSAGVPFSVVYVSDGSRLSVYLGTDSEHTDTLLGMLRGMYPQMRFALTENDTMRAFSYPELCSTQLNYGGYIKGNPTGSQDALDASQIDGVIRGMVGHPWSVSLFAQPVAITGTVRRQQVWLNRATQCSSLAEVSFSDTDNRETTSYKQRYLQAEQLVQKIQAFCDKSLECVGVGEWCVSCNYNASSPDDARLLGGLLCSAYLGDESEPEPVHAIDRMGSARTPLVNGWDYTHNSYLGANVPYPRYSTLLSSRELAVYASLPTVDTAGFAVVDDVAFDVDREVSGDLVLGTILDAGRLTGNTYSLPADELNRHALVVGLTGSGKTNTLKRLIYSLATDRGLPFMVIEPAKKEYWELYRMGFDDLQIYSVGSTEANAHTLCINPFERASVMGADGRRHSVSIQTHIDFVYAAFKASFIMYTPMPYVLERSIYEIYEDCGWDIQADVNRKGAEVYPTIEDLYFKIPDVVDAMGYDQKMRRDLIGSLQARINSLRIGSKGATLNIERSFPFDRLLQGRVVVELEDIGDDDAKAFIISLLLVNLLEVRRQQTDCQLGIRHLMLIEEAHRLLKNVQGGTGENADPRAAAVEFFCNLLAELRSKGQGFVVADQIPSKLAPDLVKNTNLKIAHRIVAADERELMGGAMHMRDEQVEALASLRQGVAAMYSEGDNRPKLVRPAYAGNYEIEGRKRLSREAILTAVSRNCISNAGNPDYAMLTDSKTEVCRRCNSHCRKKPADILRDSQVICAFDLLATKLDPKELGSCQAERIDRNIRNMLNNKVPGWDAMDTSARYCVLEMLVRRWHLERELESRLIERYMTRL